MSERTPAGPGRCHPRRATPATLQLHVALVGAFPPVWRRIEVASDLGLDELHEVLQVVYGWEDRHLYRISTGPEHDPGTTFVGPKQLGEVDEEDATLPSVDVRVDELLAEVGERRWYQYDLGDNWWLVLEVEALEEGGPPPGRARLLEGAGAAPPEDCGGLDGYRWMIAAADPTHPDHAEAREELSQRWGQELEPEELGVVAFDAATIDAALRALDLDQRPPVPARVGRPLLGLLREARDHATVVELRRLASSAGIEVEVDEDLAARMVHPFTLLLQVVGDGVKLTAAGFLPPVVVQRLFDELDLAEEWIGKGNREDLTQPVLKLRATAQRVGLLRVDRGQLKPTARGRRMAEDPVELWWHLARALPVHPHRPGRAEWQAGVLLLAAMTAGPSMPLDSVVARLLTGLGWRAGGGGPIDPREACRQMRDDLDLLHRLGAIARSPSARWPGTATPDGVVLARAALLGS